MKNIMHLRYRLGLSVLSIVLLTSCMTVDYYYSYVYTEVNFLRNNLDTDILVASIFQPRDSSFNDSVIYSGKYIHIKKGETKQIMDYAAVQYVEILNASDSSLIYSGSWNLWGENDFFTQINPIGLIDGTYIDKKPIAIGYVEDIKSVNLINNEKYITDSIDWDYWPIYPSRDDPKVYSFGRTKEEHRTMSDGKALVFCCEFNINK